MSSVLSAISTMLAAGGAMGLVYLAFLALLRSHDLRIVGEAIGRFRGR